VTLAFGADQFQGQQTADRLGGGDHLRGGQAGGGGDRRQIDAVQQRQKQEQPGQRGAKGSGR
jgi:hypothetical protein